MTDQSPSPYSGPPPMTSTREIGEATVWQIDDLILPQTTFTTDAEYARRRAAYRYEGEATATAQPLIPASDLEQVIRERDEAVAHLKAMSHVCPKPGEVVAALDFLATLMEGEDG